MLGKKIGILLLAIVFGFVVCELAVRAIGRTDPDGNFYWFSRKILPYKYPIEAARYQIAKYQANFSSYVSYDPDLGWTPRPLSISNNKLYYYNADGIRSPSCDFPIARQAPSDTLRIALFGDSFTHCDDVPFNESWGNYLQEVLQHDGLKAEVINFGVGGYGIDQAYLRWKKIGKDFHPNIVIFGLATEDILRTVNVLRPLFPPAWGEGIPFSKPRFILEKGSLKLINVPALEPAKVPGVLRDLNSWPLSRYEYWLAQHGFNNAFWFKSRFICLIYDAVMNLSSHDLGREQYLQPDTEPGRISLALIDEFAKDVSAHGAFFCVVYLPDMNALFKISHNIAPQEARFIAEVIRKYPLILPDAEMLAKVRQEVPTAVRHYNGMENRMIALSIAKSLEGYLRKMLEKISGK